MKNYLFILTIFFSNFSHAQIEEKYLELREKHVKSIKVLRGLKTYEVINLFYHQNTVTISYEKCVGEIKSKKIYLDEGNNPDSIHYVIQEREGNSEAVRIFENKYNENDRLIAIREVDTTDYKISNVLQEFFNSDDGKVDSIYTTTKEFFDDSGLGNFEDSLIYYERENYFYDSLGRKIKEEGSSGPRDFYYNESNQVVKWTGLPYDMKSDYSMVLGRSFVSQTVNYNKRGLPLKEVFKRYSVEPNGKMVKTLKMKTKYRYKFYLP